MESPMPPESNEPSAADTPPPSQGPTNAPGGAADPWPRNDAPLPRWSEPPAAHAAEPPPVGVFTGLGIVAATFVVTLVALWFAGGAPLLVRSLLAEIGIVGADAAGASLGTLGLSVLLMVAAAVLIALWCNRPARRHIRVPLNIGFGSAIGLFALVALFIGMCFALFQSGASW